MDFSLGGYDWIWIFTLKYLVKVYSVRKTVIVVFDVITFHNS